MGDSLETPFSAAGTKPLADWVDVVPNQSPSPEVHPMAAAMEWVARIVAAALMMVLPGLGGQWLDRQFAGNGFTLAGFVLGLVGSMVYLISATKQKAKVQTEKKESDISRGK